MKKKYFLFILLCFIFSICSLSSSGNISFSGKNIAKDKIDMILGMIEKNQYESALNALDSIYRTVEEYRTSAASTVKINSENYKSNLMFKGDGKTSKILTDTFTIPKGKYRVHLKTEGFCSVELINADSHDRYNFLFIIMEGDASNEATVFYNTESDANMMLQFSNLTRPYKLFFEKLN